MKVVSVKLESPSDKPIALQAMLKEDGTVIDNFPLYGVYGHPYGEYAPFELRDDRMDFGNIFAAIANGSRYSELRISHKAIVMGLKVQCHEEGGVVNEYQVTALTDIG